MKEFMFTDNKYRDTIFKETKQGLRLMKMFGLEMGSNGSFAKRLTGIFDIYTNLGTGSQCLDAASVKMDGDTIIIEADLYDGALRYHSNWQYDRELGMIVRDDWIQNISDADIYLTRAVQRYLFRYDEYEVYTQNTRWCYENIGEWQNLQFGGVTLACEGGRTTQGASPYLAMRNPMKEGVVFHLIPNGNWKMDLQTVSLGSSQAGEYGYLLEMGQSDRHLHFKLAPGQTFSFPQVLIQNLIDGSITKTAVHLQKYFLQTDTSRNRIKHPITYNPWFEHYALLKTDRLKEHVRAAKEMGCEVFEIDAGWYGSQSGDWWVQSGDWSERTDGAFYGKMCDFIEYVHSQGMKFGLWMEPERIGENTPIRRQKPEYFAKGVENYYPKLYLPEVYDYIYGEITGLIKRYSLSYMKMDFNFELGEDVSGSEFYLYYQAWYRLLNQIKEQYSDTFLEACAAGGMRTDIQTTTVYDGHFLSDNVNCWDMQAVYSQCCLRLPHYRLIKWLVLTPGASISLYDSKDCEKIDTVITTQKPGAGWDEYECVDIEFACQLSASGPFALSGNYIDMTDEQKRIVKKYVSFYKEYRSFFKDSIVIMGRDPYNVGEREGFHHLQYSHAKSGCQLLFAYRFGSVHQEYTVYVKELRKEQRYEVRDALTQEIYGGYTGETLMYRGLSLEFEKRHSGKVYYIKQEER